MASSRDKGGSEFEDASVAALFWSAVWDHFGFSATYADRGKQWCVSIVQHMLFMLAATRPNVTSILKSAMSPLYKNFTSLQSNTVTMMYRLHNYARLHDMSLRITDILNTVNYLIICCRCMAFLHC